MKILVIGGGAREHALIWKLRQDPDVKHVWCAPGNAGIAECAECLNVSVSDVQALAGEAQRLKPDLTIVGPEQPLTLGVVDEFEGRGLHILGPSLVASQLEGSKVFAKEFMARHSIPTASVYGIFDSSADAYTSLCEVDWPVVIKADGLCAGKGVLVTSSPDDATAFIERIMERQVFGDAGTRVIIEEGLAGREISYIVLTDGNNFLPLAPARDYKRAFDRDQGPNTGGMGAISADGLVTSQVAGEIDQKVVVPTIAGMAGEGRPYRGFLYFGLMITAEGPKVLEFNCRLGDPETQALVMRMDFSLASAAEATLKGQLKSFEMNWKPAASACVVAAAEGYPDKPKTGQTISGIPGRGGGAELAVFHAGTSRRDGIYYVSSGRVLTIAAAGNNVHQARLRAYEAVEKLSFEGMHYRRDIGGELETAAGT
jgi:phosphoribosylamine---glycine ligase